jgi:hypothetical protein
VKWGIRIHVGIDGGNHFVLWACVAVNKQKGIFFARYSIAIAKYGHPLKIWFNFACEHSLVREDMENIRQKVYKPFLLGSSIHNHCIEHFWRYMWTHYAWYYKHMLILLEQNGVINMGNSWHKVLMTVVFLPYLQEDVNTFVRAWNLHCVRKINENGREIDGHVLDDIFKSYEREHGYVHQC